MKDVTLNPTKEETGRKSTPNGGRDAEGKMRVDTDRIREVDQSVLTNCEVSNVAPLEPLVL